MARDVQMAGEPEWEAQEHSEKDLETKVLGEVPMQSVARWLCSTVEQLRREELQEGYWVGLPRPPPPSICMGQALYWSLGSEIRHQSRTVGVGVVVVRAGQGGEEAVCALG